MTEFSGNKSNPSFNAGLLPAVVPWQRHLGNQYSESLEINFLAISTQMRSNFLTNVGMHDKYPSVRLILLQKCTENLY